MYLLDITYNHLLYNTYGPICVAINKSIVTKIQTNNGTGKTTLLKVLLGLMKPNRGILYNAIFNNFLLDNFIVNNNYRLSTSQLKKFKIMQAYLNKYIYWILDEPYSYLDMTSIHYLKKKILECNIKYYTILITDCIQKSMLPTLIFYFGTRWI